MSVLNFLRLFGVSWDEITCQRLNYCFICPKGDTFEPFKSNNIKNKDGVKCATSEYDNKLREIIKTALGNDHIICKKMEKIELNEVK